MSTYKQVTTYKEMRRLLKKKGSIVMVNISGTEQAIQANKSEFLYIIKEIEQTRGAKGPHDYNGNKHYFDWREDYKVLYVDGGI